MFSVSNLVVHLQIINIFSEARGRRDRDCMVVGFKVVSSNPVHDEVYSMQHCVIKFVSDLRQVDGFLRVFRFSRPIKLTCAI